MAPTWLRVGIAVPVTEGQIQLPLCQPDGVPEVGVFQVRPPEVGAAQVRSCKVEASPCRPILLARLLVPAPEDGEDGLDVRGRPDLRSRLFGRTLRFFGARVLTLHLVPTADLKLDERIGERLPRRPRGAVALTGLGG